MSNETLFPKVPVGAIVPFAGLIDSGWLEDQGWLYCDGRSLSKRDYIDLFLAMGSNYGGSRDNFNLPDLRGRFARGVNHTSGNDPNAAERTASNAGGLSGDNPGSLQNFATGQPVTPFKTTEDGTHCHPVPHAPKDSNAYSIAGGHYGKWTGDSTETAKAGIHTHDIESGGDAESRPVNAYVNFIIKFRDASVGG